ncbi:MAG: TatD family hydrolase [Candidatus Caldatribacteriota bacterium]
MVLINWYFIETHTHLDLIKKDSEEVIREAAAEKVIKMVNIGIDLFSSQASIDLASRYDGVYSAIGFHPHEAKFLTLENLKGLKELAKQPKVVAIGEIGLDYYWQHSSIESQRKAFIQQIYLAQEYRLPIIIHDREAHLEVLDILDKDAKGLKVLLHCFSGDLDFARLCIERGYLLGIGGVVTFPKARKLVEVAQHAPLENIVLETDSPYLTPHPFRGKPNEPKYIPLIAEKIAQLKKVDLEVVARATSINAHNFFGLKDKE